MLIEVHGGHIQFLEFRHGPDAFIESRGDDLQTLQFEKLVQRLVEHRRVDDQKPQAWQIAKSTIKIIVLQNDQRLQMGQPHNVGREQRGAPEK